MISHIRISNTLKGRGRDTSSFFFYLVISLMMFTENTVGQSSPYELMVNALIDFNIDTIRSDELFKLTNGEQDLVILDAREPSEYNVSHISSALNVGYDNLDLSVVEHINKKSTLVVYCSVGYRSEKVAEKLKSKGFNNIVNLYGGIFEWTNKGYPLEGPENNRTERIHGYSPEWGLWIKKGKVVYDE